MRTNPPRLWSHFAIDSPRMASSRKAAHEERTDGCCNQLVFDDPCSRRACGVSKTVGEHGNKPGDEKNGGCPEIEGDEESDHFAESQFGPLVEAALEGHFSTEVNDDDAGWNVKEQNGRNPVHDMRGAEFSGCAHPLEANDKERLGKDEIAKAKFFFKFSTVLLNKMFGLEELLLDLADCQIDSFCIRTRCASGMRQRRVNKVYQETLLPNTCFGECWRSSLTALQQLVVDCVQGVSVIR